MQESNFIPNFDFSQLNQHIVTKSISRPIREGTKIFLSPKPNSFSFSKVNLDFNRLLGNTPNPRIKADSVIIDKNVFQSQDVFGPHTSNVKNQNKNKPIKLLKGISSPSFSKVLSNSSDQLNNKNAEKLKQNLPKVHSLPKLEKINTEPANYQTPNPRSQKANDVFNMRTELTPKIGHKSKESIDRVIDKNLALQNSKTYLLKKDKILRQPQSYRQDLLRDSQDIEKSNLERKNHSDIYKNMAMPYTDPKTQIFKEDIIGAHDRLTNEQLSIRLKNKDLNNYKHTANANPFYQPRSSQNQSHQPQVPYVHSKIVPFRESPMRKMKGPYAMQVFNQISKKSKNSETNSEVMSNKHSQRLSNKILSLQKEKSEGKPTFHMGYIWDPQGNELIDTNKKKVVLINQDAKNQLLNKSRFDSQSVFVTKSDLLTNTNDENYNYGNGYKPNPQFGNFQRKHLNFDLNMQ